MKNPLLGYGCETCRSLSFDSIKTREPTCRACQRPLTQLELSDVVNKARLIYLGLWVGIAAICISIGTLMLSENAESYAGRGLLILGGFGVILVVSYIGLAFLRTALGLGGWRWLTHKTVPTHPPSWYSRPTLGKGLLRESLVSLGIVTLFVILTLL